MGHRIAGVFYGENVPARILELRQGLDPLLVSSDQLSYPGTGSSGAFAALAPDMKAGVVTFNTSSSGSNFRYYPDMNTMASPVTPAAGFAGTTSVCAISNDHYAIGGSGSPFLYVFKRSDHSLATVSTSPYIAEFNADTQALTDFTALTAGGAIGAGYSLIVDPDPSEDAVYLRHNTGTTSPSRTLSKFKISTRAPYPVQAAVYRNVMWGSTQGLTPFAITYDSPHKITGTVRDIDNNPVARVVRAHRRDTGELAAQTTSNASTGDYDLRVPDIGPYDVQFMTAAGELLNDLFFAQTEPQPV